MYIADGIVCTNFWYGDSDKPDPVADMSTFVENRKRILVSDVSHGDNASELAYNL